jgi:hypothetical protein
MVKILRHCQPKGAEEQIKLNLNYSRHRSTRPKGMFIKMQKEDSIKVIRNAVVGASAIALLLILLAVMNNIPEIKNTIVAEIISVTLILKLVFLLFVVVALAYLIFPLSATLWPEENTVHEQIN